MATNSDWYRPPCPTVVFERKEEANEESQMYTLHCRLLDVNVECYGPTALITIDGTWKNKTNDPIDVTFLLPTKGTVRSMRVEIGTDRVITTSILPNRDAKILLRKQRKKVQDEEEKYDERKDDPSNNYIQTPNLFRLPIKNVKSGEIIQIHCEYAEVLDYCENGYFLFLPLAFNFAMISDKRRWRDIVHVKCFIYPMSPIETSNVECTSHEISVNKSDNIIIVDCQNFKDAEHLTNIEKYGRDFELTYSVKTFEISAFAIKSSANDFQNDTDRGTFTLMLTPPPSQEKTFGRALFFLIDRSGSMSGQPYREICRALERVLWDLRPLDRFGMCLMDDHQIYFRPMSNTLLVPATRDYIEQAMTWLAMFPPAWAGHDLLTPIQYALQEFAKIDFAEFLPHLVCIFGGSVYNEREICEHFSHMKKKRIRTILIGIGPFVNVAFLNQMSNLSGSYGHFKHISELEHLEHEICHVLNSIKTPCLRDLEIAWNEKTRSHIDKVDDDDGLSMSDHEYLVYVFIDSNCDNVPVDIKDLILSFYPIRFGDDQKEFEIYPFPLPDLYIGAPVIVSVRYKQGLCPEKIAIRGLDPRGDRIEVSTKVREESDIPVESIMMKQIVDIFSANAWMQKSKKLEWRAAAISCALNMPSIYTTTLAMETTRKGLAKQNVKIAQMMRKSGYDENNKHVRAKMEAKLRNDKNFVASTGSLLTAVGVVSYLIGDQESTFNNWPVFGGDGDFDLYGHSTYGCDTCCGHCDCECECECDEACEYICQIL